MAVRIENLAEPIPGYRLIERIGGGGFGEVWKAEAPGGLHKAIKFVFGDLKGAGDSDHRAEQELKALRRVQSVRHPYVLSLERYDIIDGQLMIVMELAERNLWDRFKECRAQGLPGIPREELLRYMEESAEALDMMNEEFDLQHLDIKPQNLFVVHQHVKVADFGLVKDLEGMQASVTGGVTPVYAAPETFDGWVSRFCDQYSLAIVYQELLTGQRPFSGTSIHQLILHHLQTPPNVQPLPPGDRAAISRALSKKPDERFPYCRDMVRLLRDADPARVSAATGARPALSDGGAEVQLVENDATSEGHSTSCLRPRSDANSGITHCIRSLDPSVLGEVRRTAPPEQHGDGVLVPSLVIGLGQVGMTLLQRLREQLTDRFQSPDHVPHIRLLLLDTDPEVMRAATHGPQGTALSASEVLLAPLQRPSYYLKPRQGRPPLEAWMNPRMLYRIPRSQVTTGVRALGRLAYCDHFRSIARRVQTELEAIVDPGALATAQRHTRLGLRSNRPRVYILAGLGGGTGSGVFLDLAYTVRALLRQAGYEQPDVVGLLLLPPLDRYRTRTLTLGNAFAALTELTHFATPGNVFAAQYHEREPAIQDAEPPFGRTILLPLPDETDEVATGELVDLAGEYLFRDLCSPLGRTADLGRADLPSPPWASRGQFYQTFGLYQVAWPRRALLRTAGRKLCQRLVTRWMSKDSKPIRDAVQDWVKEQWSGLGLGGDSFIGRLREAMQTAQQRTVEAILYAVTEPLAQRLATAGAGRKGAASVEVADPEIRAVLDEYDHLLGRPGDDGSAEAPGELVQTLRQCADTLAHEWGQKLAELPVALIEEPGFRLAGAEEALRHMIAEIERTLQHHEPLSRELSAKAIEAYGRVRALLTSSKGGRRPLLAAAEVLELLRHYPKWRYQSLLLQQVAGVFLGLRGHLSDTLREINHCRVRLTELLGQLETSPERGATGDGGSTAASETGKRLFAHDCKNLEEAVERFLGGVTPEALLELDGQLQAMLKERFEALVNVCLTTSNIVKNVARAMLETAETFAAERLGEQDVAAMFLEQHPDKEQAQGEIAGFLQEAAPELTPDRASRASELCVLALPSGQPGDAFRALVDAVAPEGGVTLAPGGEEIVFYRERSNLKLSDLEHLGSVGEDAYRQMSAADNFTPHTRIDVPFNNHR